MKVSLNYIKDNLGFDPYGNGVEDLVQKIGSQLGAIEEVVPVYKKWQGAVVVNVVKCDQHPNADKLHVCLVDDDGVNKDVERNSDGLVTVVCGAPNVHAGMLAVWLPPNTVVPSTHDDKEPFVLAIKELRGVLSNGMLASPSELGLSNDHDGILEITNKDFTELPKPGTPFLDLLSLNDTVLDLENKMFTHRPDCFGLIGVAREFAGISGQQFKSPDWYLHKELLPEPTDEFPINVINLAPKLVSRFLMQVIKDIKVGPSPLWLQAFLARVGQNSVNNIVDITNYFMLVTGQPMHAFDYDKVAKNGDISKVGPRLANEGESISLLNGKTIKLSSKDIVIAAGETPIALAGVMGGANTEVDINTKNIILECATFDMYAVRRTSMRHGLFTDAVTRYTKGQSPLQNDAILAKTTKTILELFGGNLASNTLDASAHSNNTNKVNVSVDFINSRLGINISVEQIAQLLGNVEIDVDVNNNELIINPPFWRTDLEIKEDIVEEIGRLYGYNKIEISLPTRQIKPAKKDELIQIKNIIREILKNLGANELLTYSFVHGRLQKSANQNVEESYALSNALSPALQYYRQSISPSILDKVHLNIKAGYNKFALFEIGKSHSKILPKVNDIPFEQELLAYVFASTNKQAPSGASYYQAKMITQELFNKLDVSVNYVLAKDCKETPAYSKPFNLDRSAYIFIDNTLIGIVGEYLSLTKKSLKLPDYCSGFEIDISRLLNKLQKKPNYVALYKFPSIDQDITLQTNYDSYYEPVYQAFENSVNSILDDNINYKITPVEIFMKDDYKRYTFRLKLTPKTKTLTTQEATSLVDTAVNNIQTLFNIKRI